MKRKIKIPEMKKEDIVKWYATIRPIVYHNETPVFLRKLTEDELTNVSYTGLNEMGDYGENVDLSEMSVLADVKMLHRWGYYAYFKPSVGEVIRQIPKELLSKVVAFQIIHVASMSIFKPEFNAGYHVSVVRLYQERGTNEKAEEVTNYPDENSVLPIGMSATEFKQMKELHEMLA